MATWDISDGFFKNFKFHVAVPNKTDLYGISSQEVSTERRLQISRKPLVDGADVEDFGRNERSYNVEVIFYGGNYLDRVDQFEAILNQGTTGTLILPDVSDAISAKVARHVRRTTTESITTIQVTWVEDLATPVNLAGFTQLDPENTSSAANSAAKDALKKDDPVSALGTINAALAGISSGAKAVDSAVNDNALINGIKAVNNSVVNATSAANSILNIAPNTRQTILSNIGMVQSTLRGINSVVSGVQNFNDQLQISTTQPNPTRYNSGTSAVDFKKVGVATATTVNGSGTVVPDSGTAATSVGSYPDAAKKLQAQLDTMASSRLALEQQIAGTSGSVSDITAASLALELQMADLINIFSIESTFQVLTITQTSLHEIGFQNGFDVSQISTLYVLNPKLTDCMNIPPGTVVYL